MIAGAAAAGSPVLPGTYGATGSAIPYPALGLRREGFGRRVVSYVLDVLPCLLLALLHFLPVIGWIGFGVLAGGYWLLRDMNGASFGKTIVGTVVLTAGGLPASTGQRIFRNLPLAIPALLEIIPILGLVLAPIAALIIFAAEILILLITGRRLGDHLAGTDVFRKLA